MRKRNQNPKNKSKEKINEEVGTLQLGGIPQVMIANGRSPRSNSNNLNNEDIQLAKQELYTAMKENQLEQIPKILEKL